MIVASVLFQNIMLEQKRSELWHTHTFATHSARNWQRVVWEDWNSSSNWQRVVWEDLKRNDCYVSDWLRGKSEVDIDQYFSSLRQWVVSTVKYPERQTHQFRTQAALPTRLVLLVEQFEQVLVVTDTKLSSESRWESAKRGCNRLWLWSRSQPICRTRVKGWNFWRLSKGFARKQSSETCFSWKTEPGHSLLTV